MLSFPFFPVQIGQPCKSCKSDEKKYRVGERDGEGWVECWCVACPWTPLVRHCFRLYGFFFNNWHPWLWNNKVIFNWSLINLVSLYVWNQLVSAYHGREVYRTTYHMPLALQNEVLSVRCSLLKVLEFMVLGMEKSWKKFWNQGEGPCIATE